MQRAEEVLNRAIVQNETGALTVCLAYVDAQIEYAGEDRTGEGILQFAQKLVSSPGTRDGLYWNNYSGGLESPLGALLTENSSPDEPGMYFGYRYRILTSQGESAVGGSREFLIEGNLLGGFGLIAWPAEYDVTGIHTFIVNHLCQVFEKDLGPGTDGAARRITKFDPDESWRVVD